MVTTFSPSAPLKEAFTRIATAAWLRRVGAALFALVLLGGAFAIVMAQVAGNRGIAPTASSADYEVRGIEVDERADTGEEAREQAWRRAQRLAWQQIDGPPVSDSQLSSMVSSIVIQRERIGPKRYIATLGVIFDRQRAGRYLGGAATARSSAPMLLIPVTVSGGTFTTFEVRNAWQRSWAEFNPGRSRIDYVRPSGAGGDSLLLNYGQAGRRSRAWWRSTLDQYGAADVLVPIARLDHQFPGGPVTGTFTARYGPESRVLETFELTADSPARMAEMYQQAVARIDSIYEAALVDGKLQPDPTLTAGASGEIDPALQRLIEIGRAVRERETAAAAAAEAGLNPEVNADQGDVPTPAPVSVTNYTVQFDTPDGSAFDGALTSVRGTPGVRGVAVTSTAMGGTSVMNVGFTGSLDELAAALRSRGFTVRQGANALAISR